MAGSGPVRLDPFVSEFGHLKILLSFSTAVCHYRAR